MRTPLLDGRIVAVPIFCPCALTMSAWAERAVCCAIAGVQYTAIAAHRQNSAGMTKNRRIGMNLLRNLGPFAGLPAAYSRVRSSVNTLRCSQHSVLPHRLSGSYNPSSDKFRLAYSEHNPSTFLIGQHRRSATTTLPGNG